MGEDLRNIDTEICEVDPIQCYLPRHDLLRDIFGFADSKAVRDIVSFLRGERRSVYSRSLQRFGCKPISGVFEAGKDLDVSLP